jgi:protease II
MKNHFTQKYLEAFPFSGFTSLNSPSEFLYLYEKNSRKTLCRFDCKKHKSLEEGEELIDLDFNKRAFQALKIINECLYVMSDERNEENFNLYKIDLNRKEIIQITENEYTACLFIHGADEKAYYCSRIIDRSGLFVNEVFMHDLKTNQKEFIVDDRNDLYRVSWGDVIPSKNKRFVLLNVDRNNERTHKNFCLVSLDGREKKIVIPEDYESSRFYFVGEEVDTDSGFYFVSDVSGYDDLYYYNFGSTQVLKLTSTN